MKSLIKAIYTFILVVLCWWTILEVSAAECKFGICADTKTLSNGTSQMNIYETLWMWHKNSNWETSVMTFVSDIIYAATYFIWTVVTAALIVSWLMFVFSWANSSLRNRAKTWFKYALYWLIIVILSVIIVRAVQFIARWWS
jgi:hypothetical protein